MRKRYLGLAAFALALRFSSSFRRQLILCVIRTQLGTQIALSFTRFFLGSFMPPVMYKFWFLMPGLVGQDGCQVMHNLHFERRGIKYGVHPRENMDVLTPYHGESTKEIDPINPSGIVHFGLVLTKELVNFALFGRPPERTPTPLGAELNDNAPVILFGHGGGWVCQGTDVQTNQTTAVARAGFQIYLYNYPLAPENRFPDAVVSTLRAMAWLFREKGVKKLSLMGESAGGNLITMAAALVYNHELLDALGKEVGIPLSDWEYPQVTCVVSWYSILCSEHWREAEWLSPGLEKVFDLYISGRFGNKVALLDLENDLHDYPPTLIICGTTDPLGLAQSGIAAHEMLQRKGIDSTLRLFRATHGFIGYPIQFQQAFSGGDSTHWKETALPAINETIQFLKQNNT